MGVGVSLEMVCSTNATRKPSQMAAAPAGLSNAPHGCRPCLWGQPASGWRRSAELQVLISGDVVLELVGLKEVAQLLEVALVQLVHFLLRGMQRLLHLDGLAHCKAQKRAAAQSGNHLGSHGPLVQACTP